MPFIPVWVHLQKDTSISMKLCMKTVSRSFSRSPSNKQTKEIQCRTERRFSLCHNVAGKCSALDSTPCFTLIQAIPKTVCIEIIVLWRSQTHPESPSASSYQHPVLKTLKFISSFVTVEVDESTCIETRLRVILINVMPCVYLSIICFMYYGLLSQLIISVHTTLYPDVMHHLLVNQTIKSIQLLYNYQYVPLTKSLWKNRIYPVMHKRPAFKIFSGKVESEELEWKPI